MSVTRFRRDSNMEDKVFEAGHWSEWLSAEARVRFQPERSALYRLFRTLVRGFSSPAWVFIGGLAVGSLVANCAQRGRRRSWEYIGTGILMGLTPAH